MPHAHPAAGPSGASVCFRPAYDDKGTDNGHGRGKDKGIDKEHDKGRSSTHWDQGSHWDWAPPAHQRDRTHPPPYNGLFLKREGNPGVLNKNDPR